MISHNPIATPCRDCPCYVDPSQPGVVEISTRTTGGDWVVEFICAGCAGRRDEKKRAPVTAERNHPEPRG